MSGVLVAQVEVTDSSDKTIRGTWIFDRANGGVMVPASGNVFPSDPKAGEWFWRSDLHVLFHRSEDNTTWDSATVVPSSINHSGLSELTSDDHPQYLLVNGARMMAGDLNMGGHDITNAGLVNGIDLLTHGSRHIGGGPDAIPTATQTADGLLSMSDKAKLDRMDQAVLMWGNASVANTTTTRYLTPNWSDSIAPTVPVQFRMATGGLVENLRVRHNMPAGNGGNIIYTVRKNGVPMPLAVTLASNVQDGIDSQHSFTAVAGDLLDIQVTKTSSIGTSPSNIAVTLEVKA